MKIKTADLIGDPLDWAVADAENINLEMHYALGGKKWEPTIDWSQGGPIIERERIRVEPFFGAWLACAWYEDNDEYRLFYRGPTPLVAAMRCRVASKLGDEVDVPEELLT